MSNSSRSGRFLGTAKDLFPVAFELVDAGGVGCVVAVDETGVGGVDGSGIKVGVGAGAGAGVDGSGINGAVGVGRCWLKAARLSSESTTGVT